MWTAGSNSFYKKLDDDFFTQGLGNRPLWIVGEDREPKKLDKDFFFSFGDEDKQLSKLQQNLVEDMRALKRDAKFVYVHEEANDLWREFQHNIAKKAFHDKSLGGSLKMKLALNALKLATVYSASRFNLHKGDIMIDAEDMERAIKDINMHEQMWQLAIDKMHNLSQDQPTSSHMTDFQKVIYHINRLGGSAKSSDITNATGWFADDWQRIRQTMLDNKLIRFEIIEKEDTLGRLRKSILYKLPKTKKID